MSYMINVSAILRPDSTLDYLTGFQENTLNIFLNLLFPYLYESIMFSVYCECAVAIIPKENYILSQFVFTFEVGFL